MAIMALNICIAAGKLMLALTDYLREQKYIIDNPNSIFIENKLIPNVNVPF